MKLSIFFAQKLVIKKNTVARGKFQEENTTKWNLLKNTSANKIYMQKVKISYSQFLLMVLERKMVFPEDSDWSDKADLD